MISGQESTKYKFLALIYSHQSNNPDIIVSDFSALFDRKCREIDFEVVTPGMVGKNYCVHGKHGFMYSKTSSSICEWIIEDLPKITPKPCSCTPEDYMWYLEIFIFFNV
ncbi:hypothetical protein RF11_13618 [Thelohanellus kitauei]|uniref:Sortilin C-terminal domain-containing protein n=1 Tax=Thelohanellus kitauei TaxID=669202 RepID=A0A0C2ILS0_THEKT|nr:hypothetical protein RF11_13618 [Thelohanellus kitauei]